MFLKYALLFGGKLTLYAVVDFTVGFFGEISASAHTIDTSARAFCAVFIRAGKACIDYRLEYFTCESGFIIVV